MNGIDKHFHGGVCRECGGTDLEWDYTLNRKIDGVLVTLNDVNVIVFLGCNECSATLALMSLDEFIIMTGDTPNLRERVKARYRL